MRSSISSKFLSTFALLLSVVIPSWAGDEDMDSPTDQQSDSVFLEIPTHQSKYDKRHHLYRKYWDALIPTQNVIQYAGNMGFLSVGIGWDYGKHRQWETHLLLGFLPKFDSKRAKITMTLKENYMPWSYELGHDFSVEPLSCGLYLNTVFGHEFWVSEPVRYPNNYYQLSTRIRTNVFIGERITKELSNSQKYFVKSVTFFYEVSSNDLYIIMAVRNNYITLKDILCLSVGMKFQLL